MAFSFGRAGKWAFFVFQHMLHKKHVLSVLKKATTVFVAVTTILLSFGLPFFPSSVPVARAAAISTVAAVDQDTTGFGLDGRDFSVSWTNDAQPTGYVGTMIFIVPNSVSLTASNVLVDGCSGSAACQNRGFFTQYAQTSLIIPQFEVNDSEGTAWNAATSYKACVLSQAAVNELKCSAAFSVISESAGDVTDVNPPFVEHFAAHSAPESTNAVLTTVVLDDQTTATQFATASSGAVLNLFYGTDVSAAETAVAGTRISGNLFQFTVPSASVPAAGGTFEYYIRASDVAGNDTFFCIDPSATTAATCKTSPFVVTTGSVGPRSISGTIFSAGVALEGALVFPGGLATARTSSAADGTYTITGIPNNSAFDVTAYKSGYCKQVRFEPIGTADVTGININLNLGECGFVAGGDGGKPFVLFAGPPEWSFGIPLNEKMRVGLSQAMTASTINDADPTDSGSNVYLTTDDGTTKVAGAVTYCADNTGPGCTALFTGDTNVILFAPTSNLAADTFYTLVITEAVTSTSGQSIEGNRLGGGHNLSFTTGGGTFSGGTVTTNFGNTGEFMPPYVRSMIPGPGVLAARNTDILVELSERMDTSTIGTSTVQLWNLTTSSQVTLAASAITVDNNEQRFITIDPGTLAANSEYEVRIKGSVSSATAIALMPPGSTQATTDAFLSFFQTSGSSDSTAPTIFAGTAAGSTGVAVNTGSLEFGFSEQLAFSTITSSNVTLKRGSTSVGVSVQYDPGENIVFVTPNDVLAPNTSYTVTFGTGVTDLAGVALASQQSFTYTTGAADTVSPKLVDTRCDDNTCSLFFNEPMNHDTQADANYATSVLNSSNITAEVTSDASPAAALNTLSGVTLAYDSQDMMLTVKGLAGSAIALTSGSSFLFTVNTGVDDLSGNAIGGTDNTWRGQAESSSETFGSFGDFGMFGPPIAGSGAVGSVFIPEGFGSFTAEQFSFGQADMAFPFNSMASQDSNVFQVRFNPAQVLQDNDQVVLTFPSGTGVSSAAPDTFSPFYTDINEFGSGTIVFDTALDSDGVSVDTTSRQVTVQLSVTGTPGANDVYTIDLSGITNPAIPKGPETGGYTVDIKVLRAGVAIFNSTSMTYFIQEAGTRSITINLYAGSQSSPDNVSGSVFLFGGGPSGPLDKNITISAGSGTLALTSLPDGCYFFGTDSFITLGSSDYFGQMSPEPICVNASSSSVTKNIVLTSATASGASVALTVKLDGISDFGGVDIDLFAGGPASFVVKTLSSVGVPASAGYTLRLPQNGTWFVGVGPSFPKGPSATKITAQLPGVPPPPIDLIVSGLGSSPTISTGFFAPPGVSFNSSTNTLTVTLAAADKAITGTVTDGTSALQNVEVFMHSQGFGAPAFTTTDAAGAFTINVSDFGSYEIGAFKDGLPPAFYPIEVLPDGSDAGTAIDIFFKGKQITNSNALVIKLKKPSFTISGKVLDFTGNAISYAPVFGSDANGVFVGGGSDSNGNYTLFVDAGTWTIKSELPPDKTDTCGSFSKTVTVTTANKPSQDLRPTTGTCYDISGTVTVGGTALQNVPLFVDEWDTTNSRPAAGGTFKGTSTDSSGAYSVKVAGAKTYRIGTFDPSIGEVSITQAVAAANVTGADITVTSGAITFSFTGGTASMDAFIEVKKTDGTSRIGTQQNGLASNATITVPSGTYNYFVDVFGFGSFSGEVTTGNTVTIDLSTATFITLSGNVKDSSDTNLTGVLVTAKDTTTGLIRTALTDSNGDYSLDIKEGKYSVSVARAGYVPGQEPSEPVFTQNTANYDFGGSSPDQTAMAKAAQTISGTVFESNGSTAMDKGFVTGTETTTNLVVTAPIDPQDGSYSLPVIDGTWSVSAKGPLHAKTTLSANATVSGSDTTGKNVTLTADTTRVPKGESKVLDGSVGGSLDDTENSGIKLTVGAGVLQAGSGNVTVEVEKNFAAPDTKNFAPLGDASFEIAATGTTTIKNLNGNADLEIDYTSLVSDLPSGVSESDLKLAYYSAERGEYIPVEGGFTVDSTNNTINGQTSHFTTFAVVYALGATATTTTTTTTTTTAGVPVGGGGGGGGGGAETPAAEPTAEPAAAEPEVQPAAEVSLEGIEIPTLDKPVAEMTTDELRATIAQFLAAIQQLQVLLAQITGPTAIADVPAGFTFDTALKLGQSSKDVMYLQMVLNTDTATRLTGTGVGSPGSETQYFGPLTKAAVIKFQEKYAADVLAPWELTSGTGLVGSTTREKLNTLLTQ